MAELPVSDEVDDHVILELLAVLGRDAEDLRHVLHRVRVHVEDRRLDRLCQVRAVDPTARLARGRRETNLIVNDHVDRTAYLIIRQVCHLHTLVYYTLTCECCITVNDKWNYLFSVDISH
jgi:hypothetical protein